MFDWIMSLVAPHRCVGCGSEGSLLCEACSSKLVPAVGRCYRCHRIADNFRTCANCRRTSKLFSVAARTRYDSIGEELVKKLKFEHSTAGARDVARELTALVPDTKDLIITHLPTATSRVRERGFDQAKLIAKRLSTDAGLPYTVFLARSGGARQVGASRNERFAHTSGMFRIRHQQLLTGATILLIDDVITTGASLESAARTLRANGAKRVYGLVFCQA